MGFKVSENYAGGNYMNAADVPSPFTAEIAAVDMETMRDDTEKLALTITGTDKLLLLNKTNAEELAEAYGDDTDSWIGKPVVVYTSRTLFQGKRVPAIRVRKPLESEIKTEAAETANA